MNLGLGKLNFTFQDKPLLFGGKALEYYGIRETHNDIDLVASEADHARLTAQFPDHLKVLATDVGVIELEFEIWNTICTFGYDYLSEGAIEKDDFLVASLEKLIFLKALDKDGEKGKRDLRLIVEHVLRKAYGK